MWHRSSVFSYVVLWMFFNYVYSHLEINLCFLLCRSQFHEFFPFLCHQAKCHPELPSQPHLAVRSVLVLALWLISKPKLSLPEHSEQRPPQYHLHRRGLFQAQDQGEAVESRHSHRPSPAQHPHWHQPGYQHSTAATVRPVRLLLAHWTLLLS